MSCLQSVQPKHLFVACDGPGSGDPELMEACLQARSVIEQAITWPCQVTRLYRDQHLGCRHGVAEAISWFFSQVEEGIILEDDVLPDPSFFVYCAELLERYRDDHRVGMVSGCTIRNLPPRDGSSYRFSRFFHVWGWASWRRAWMHYDSEMSSWPILRQQNWLSDLGGKRFARYWRREFDRVWTGDCDTWDYIWMLSCWAQGQVCILPAVNLVDNHGFEDPRATHTTLDRSPLPKSGCIQHPLRHPTHRFVDHAVDAIDLARYYAPRLPQRMFRRVQKEVRRLRHAVLCT